MPVPTGPWAAEPAAGTSALLLSCTLLFWKTQHEVVFVMSLVLPSAQRPSWGGGGSPAICVLVSRPSWLWSNSEFWMMTVPPELVPE